jgi:hypothetical protein
MGGNVGGGIFGGGQGISTPGTINNQNNYTPSQGFTDQSTPAPVPINPGPEAAPTPVAAQGVQSSFGSTTNATQQPTQSQNPFTGGLGGYGYRYGDSTQQPSPQQPQNPYGTYGGNPYMGNPYGSGNYGGSFGGGGQEYGGLMGILQHLFGGQGYGQQPQPQQPQQPPAQQPPQMFPDVIQASHPLGGEYQ